MCGIAGIISNAPMPELRRSLALMLGAMHHRGPDDDGCEVAGSSSSAVGLCAARLAIQDISPRGHQPMVSPLTGAIIAFNGEVYNVAELRRELTGSGHVFRGGSDTEVVLAAYDQWGCDCVARIRGMFGLAVWDPRRDRLFLARDRLGIKPLYYADREGPLLFGSEVRAVLASGLVHRQLSRAGLASYLTLGAVREPLSIIEGVRELPPGHFATWSRGRLELVEYWSLRDAFQRESAASSRAAAVELVREQLAGAVRQHLISDVTLGVFLSGGIDSSAIAALASLGGSTPRTVSVIFPQLEFSEERFIQTMSERLGTDHASIRLDDQAFLHGLSDAVGAMDQPTVDGVNTYVVSQAARQAGLTVALSGLGGDELFAGYDSFRRVPRLEQMRAHTPAVLGRSSARILRTARGDSDRFDKLARWLENTDGTESAYELQRELFGPRARRDLLSGELPPLRPATSESPSDLDPVNEVSYLELTRYMRNVLLRDADAMSMAHGLEVRVPFLDHKVVELVASLPGGYKLPGPSPKALLVEALGEMLPAEVVQRKKMGFTLPFDVWMRNGLRHEVEGRLLDHTYGGPVADTLNPSVVRDVWTRFIEGRGYWSRPWSLFVLKAWSERNLGA